MISVKKINLFVLLFAIALLFILKPEKHLYFDEPFQIMCSKGITNRNIEKFDKNIITSTDLNKENTLSNVFTGGTDSIHYIFLHYLTGFFGNGINTYVYFSLFWAVLSLIAFYFLSNLLIGENIFVSLAIIVFLTHIYFLNQAYSIRHYIMTLFFIIISGYYFFTYLLKNNSHKNLLLLLLFCDLSLMSHYYAIYIIMIYAFALLYQFRLTLFSTNNILIILINVTTVFIYFYLHGHIFKSHYGHMGTWQYNIQNKSMVPFNLYNEVSFIARNTSVNFLIYFSLLKDIFIVRIIAFLLVILIYIMGIKYLISDPKEKKKYHLLFFLGMVSVILSTVTAGMTRNNNMFAFRYFLFSMPFCCIFIILFLRLVFNNPKYNFVLKSAILAIIILPGLFLFSLHRFQKHENNLPCNHLLVVQEIIKNNVHKIEVPETVDAVFINCLLPTNYNITYYLNPKVNNAVLYNNNNTETISLFKNELIVLF